MDDDYSELGFDGLDLFLPGVDLVLWVRLIAGLLALVIGLVLGFVVI
ncbi:MAG: hypothetical protein JWO88_1384 [Frankiales bacterium]|jgi:ABC-type dipeptide/oligopeptide/nickel transport system permease subunit|nr:hypothetical protein [Frankiales bacterium]